MAWKLNAAIFCLLIIGLSPLGHGAALRGEGIPKPPNLLNGNRQGRLLFGQNEPKSEVRPGKLIIGLNGSTPEDYSNIPESLKSGSEPLPEDHYQADQAVTGLREPQLLQGSVYSLGVSNSPAVHQLLGMRPKVDCEDDAMMLRIHGGIGSFLYGFLIDRGSVPPLPLSRVPSECGLNVQKTRWGLIFVIPYDGCYVAQEVDAYIFPLQLWGLPAKMSCPMSNLAPSPPSVSCYPNWMIVKMQVSAPVEDLWVKVGNEWKTLLKASSECGYSIGSHSEKVEISAPYKPCMEAKDGMYSFHMAAKNEFKAFCPSLVPSLPPDISSPVSSDQTGDLNAVAPIESMPTDTSSIPVQRPTVWPSYGRPYQSPTLGLPPLPYKPTWAGLRSVANSTTQVPTPTTSSAKSYQVGQIPSLPFPITLKPQRTPPITKVPDSTAPPKKPKPAPVDYTSTSRTKFQSQSSKLVQSSELFEESSNVPGKPILLAPESVSPPAAKKPSSFLGEKSFYPAVPQMRPESITPERRWSFPSLALQKPAVLPTTAPSEPLVASRILGAKGFYEAGSEILSGSAFAQELQQTQYPKRPAILPTAAPSKSLEASNELGVTGVPYQAGPEKLSGSVFAQGPHPPQYPKRPAIIPIAAPSTSLEASNDFGVTDVHYQAGSEKLSGSAFVQELHPPQYPKRPAIIPIAAPSTSLDAFVGLRKADSFQAVPLMSRPFGYSECCPSTALYSSCCRSQASYHQHTHHHFGFPHPIFNPGAAAGSARSATSFSTGEHDGFATQPARVQTVEYESRSGALPLYEEIQQGASKSLASSSSPHRDVPVNPSVLDSFIPPSKRLWAAGVPQSLGSPYKYTTATSHSQDYKPVSGFPPNLSQSSLVYSELAQRNQNVGPAFEENHHPSLPTSSRTNPEPFIFLPHEKTSRLNYGHPAYPYSTHFDDESLTYSEAKVPPAVDEPHPFPSKSELPEQDTKFQLNPGLSKHAFGSEPSVYLKVLSQEQVHGTHGKSPYSSSDYVTHLQALSEPFNQHWVPVVHPKQGEEVKSFVRHT